MSAKRLGLASQCEGGDRNGTGALHLSAPAALPGFLNSFKAQAAQFIFAHSVLASLNSDEVRSTSKIMPVGGQKFPSSRPAWSSFEGAMWEVVTGAGTDGTRVARAASMLSLFAARSLTNSTGAFRHPP